MNKSQQGNEFSLEGKSILVSGALGLIGREVCDAFACYGAKVILGDILDEKLIREYAAQISQKYDTQTLGLYLDISSVQSIEKSIEQIRAVGMDIDVYVHLAAIDAKFDDNINEIVPSAFEDFPHAAWLKSVDVNINGTFYVIQCAIREMLKKKGGTVIIVASTYSLVAPNQRLYRKRGESRQLYKPIDYVATKSILPNFTRYLATFYGDRGIRANCIVPHGVFNGHDDEFVANFSELSPLGRMCDAKELRGPFVFLASDAASYMTGSTLVVDGGWTAW